MGRYAFTLLVVALCLGAGCLSGPPATAPPGDRTTEFRTTTAPTTTEPTTTPAPTPDPFVLDEIVEVQSDSDEPHEVSVAVLDLNDGSAVRTVNETLDPDAEFDVPRERPNAEHRRVVVRVDGTVVFDRTVYTAEQYWVTVHSATNASVSMAVA
jgi:hypothetical protein